MADPFWSLRNEILASEQIRNDWLKYKLFASAVLGGVAFGVSSEVSIRPIVLLVPFVCLYADIICLHNQIRIDVISRFLRASSDPIAEWEEFASKHGKHFSLESLAISTSTRLISLLVFADGAHNLWITENPDDAVFLFGLAGTACGLFGVLASVFIVRKVRRSQMEIGSEGMDRESDRGGV